MFTLQSLPEEVKIIVFDQKNAEINNSIAVFHKLKSEQLGKVLQILVSVITKEIPVKEFPARVKKIGLTGVDVDKLVLDFAILRLLPLRDWLEDVDTLVTKLKKNQK